MELSGDWNLFALSPLKCKASQILNVVTEFVTKFFQQTFTEGEMFRKCIFTVFRNTKILYSSQIGFNIQLTNILFSYCKDEALVKIVKKISSKFCILQLRRSKLPNLADRNQHFIYDNHKVIIFHLFNDIFPLIQKLYGKMKQKLALLFLSCMTVSRMTLT